MKYKTLKETIQDIIEAALPRSKGEVKAHIDGSETMISTLKKYLRSARNPALKKEIENQIKFWEKQIAGANVDLGESIMEGTMKSAYPWFSGKLQAGWYNVNSGKAHVIKVDDRHDAILQYPDIRPVLNNPAAFGLSEKDIKSALKADAEHDRGFKGISDEDEDKDADEVSQGKFNALKGKGPIVNAPLTSMLYKMGWVSIESTKEDMEFVMGTKEHLKMAAAVALKHFPVNQRTYLRGSLSMRIYGKSMGSIKDMHSREEIQKFIDKA
jgi:hypothetical protein